MFSRAVSCGSNPAPSSIIGQTLPPQRTAPREGFITPATSFKSVDLPAPLLPTSPTTSPRPSEKLTPRSAQKLSFSLCAPRPSSTNHCLSEKPRSIPRSKRIETASASTMMSLFLLFISFTVKRNR